MIIVPVSYNGTSLQSTDYESWIPRDMAGLQPPVIASYVQRAGAWPVYSGKDFQPASVILNIKCLGSGTGYMSQFETLNTLFSVEDETPRQFIVKDTSDSDTQYYVYATCKGMYGGNDGSVATVQLALDDPIWQSVTQNSQTFAVTATTDSTSVTNNGNADAYPIFEITPTSLPSTDFLHNTFLQVLPSSTDPWPGRPLCITNSTDTAVTFDTAALVTAGKMQADGDDLRVFQDGTEVNRWLSGINTTDTKVWVVADMPAAQNMTLKTAIASTDTITEISLNVTSANRSALATIPNAGRVILDSSLGSTDSEEFIYTAKNITTTKLTLTVSARSVRNTAAISFAVGANVRYLPYDFNLVYGNTSITAPVVDDTRKPVIDLTSTNSSWTYTSFVDDERTRAGGWREIAAKTSNPALSRSDTYRSINDAGDTDPATEIGCKALTYQALGVYRADTVRLGWINYFPDQISSVSSSGDQYQDSASTPTVSLQASKDGIRYAVLWTVSGQSATDFSTWTNWSKASTDATLPANAKYLKFIMAGSITGSADYSSKAGMNACTVGLTNVPHVMIRTETSNYKLNCTLRNDTTGETMEVTLPMALNTTAYIDTDPEFPTVTYLGRVTNGAVRLNGVRAAWLKLQPGANTIGYETSLLAANNMNIVIKWRDRVNQL